MLLSKQKRGKSAAQIVWQKGRHEEGEIHT